MKKFFFFFKFIFKLVLYINNYPYIKGKVNNYLDPLTKQCGITCPTSYYLDVINNICALVCPPNFYAHPIT